MKREEVITAKLYKKQLEMLKKSVTEIQQEEIPITIRPGYETYMLSEIGRMISDLIRNVDDRIVKSEGSK